MVPRYGNTNVLVYILICSVLGSFTVMSCKGLSIGLKEIFSNKPSAPPIYTGAFAIIIIACIIIQMNYLNKSLDIFNTAIVTTVYYVLFTLFVMIASSLLFKELLNVSFQDFVGCLCGFSTIVCALCLIHFFKASGSTGNYDNDLLFLEAFGKESYNEQRRFSSRSAYKHDDHEFRKINHNNSQIIEKSQSEKNQNINCDLNEESQNDEEEIESLDYDTTSKYNMNIETTTTPFFKRLTNTMNLGGLGFSRLKNGNNRYYRYNKLTDSNEIENDHLKMQESYLNRSTTKFRNESNEPVKFILNTSKSPFENANESKFSPNTIKNKNSINNDKNNNSNNSNNNKNDDKTKLYALNERKEKLNKQLNDQHSSLISAES
jgi:hypothetical protein